MKKFILKLVLFDEKDKRKAMKIVSALQGIDEISIDMKGQKLIIIGTVDPVSVVSKLRKFWSADIISVGPAKEPEKKEEPKKEEPKKEEAKKEEPAKVEPKKEEGKKEGEEPKKEEPKKEEEKKVAPPVIEPIIGTAMPYRPYYPPMQMQTRPYYPPMQQTRPYYPPMQTYYYPHHSMEENPNACVIC